MGEKLQKPAICGCGGRCYYPTDGRRTLYCEKCGGKYSEDDFRENGG